MSKKKIQEIVEDYFKEGLGQWEASYELYDVEYVKEGSD